MITLYLDMDGVLANFQKAYAALPSNESDDMKFRDAVMIHHIFENLELMPDAQKLLDYVSTLHHVQIEILTSLGTDDLVRGYNTKLQKGIWLDKHDIPYEPNFVRTQGQKALYATPTSILIDDSVGCIEPFIAAGGIGILHRTADETIPLLQSAIERITTMIDSM